MPKGLVMSDEPVPATPGSTVEICPFTGTSKQGAALLAEISDKHAVLVGLEHEVAFGDALAIRYWDGDLAAYQVSVRVSDPNPTVERTEVLLLGTWKTVELRRDSAFRCPGSRSSPRRGTTPARSRGAISSWPPISLVSAVASPESARRRRSTPPSTCARATTRALRGSRCASCGSPARVRIVERRAGVQAHDGRGARVAPGLA